VADGEGGGAAEEFMARTRVHPVSAYVEFPEVILEGVRCTVTAEEYRERARNERLIVSAEPYIEDEEAA
jgi:hypothetical protein